MDFSAAMNYLDGRQMADALDEINADSFTPKTFNSVTNTTKQKKAEAETMKPDLKANRTNPTEDPLFHESIFEDVDVRLERWVKKVYNFRQKQFVAGN